VVAVVFDRIVQADPPTERDFMLHRALGIPLRHHTAKALRLYDGISVYRTSAQAAALATLSPHLGRFVAELRIPQTRSLRYELNTARKGHCTLWGEPAHLLAQVESVSPV
jgi:hypothetical protein